MARSENTPDPIFVVTRFLAGLSLGVLLATALVAAQGVQPSADDLRLEAALAQYRGGQHDEALRAMARFTRGQVTEAPKTFSRTLTGQRLLKGGRDGLLVRLALGLMFVEAGLEAFERDDQDLSGAFLTVGHVWVTRHLQALPDRGNDLSVPAAVAQDLCVVAVGPLIGLLQLDAARKAWKLCPPQVQALPHVMVLRGSIEEIAASERMDPSAHFYAPGSEYGPGGVPVNRDQAVDRLTWGIYDRDAWRRGERRRVQLWRAAEAWYAKAVAAEAGNDMARLRLAYVRSHLDDRRDAALGFPWLLDSSNRVAPDVRYLAHLFSARVAEEEGEPGRTRAVAHYQQAIRIMPKNQVAFLGLSRLHFDDDRGEAARLVREALARPTELVDPWFGYDMEFAFEAAYVVERWYGEVQLAAVGGAREP